MFLRFVDDSGHLRIVRMSEISTVSVEEYMIILDIKGGRPLKIKPDKETLEEVDLVLTTIMCLILDPPENICAL